VAGPNVLTLPVGTSTAANYTLAGSNGFNGTATVRLQTVAPFGGTLSASANTVAAGGTVTLRVDAPRTMAAGLYQVRVQFVSGTTVREQLVTISVQAMTAVRGRPTR
jgi:hypothetical protein